METQIPIIGTVRDGRVTLNVPINKVSTPATPIPDEMLLAVCRHAFPSIEALGESLYWLRCSTEDKGGEVVGISRAAVMLYEHTGENIELADWLIRLAGHINDLQESLPHYERALELYRTNGYAGFGLDAWCWFSQRLYESGNPDAALIVLTEMVDVAIQNPRLFCLDRLDDNCHSFKQLAEILKNTNAAASKACSRFHESGNEAAFIKAWKAWRGDQKHEALCRCSLCGGLLK